MPIEFYCPGCGNLMRTPDETAGRKGRCPTCQLKVQIPGSSVAASSSESAVPRTAVSAVTKRSGAEPIRFDCGKCGKTLSIAAANAGKKGQCPHCGELMSIPMKSPAAGQRWKGTPKEKPKPAPARSPAPTPQAAPAPQPAPVKANGEKIEFHCSNCREVVRVGVAAAGKKGQCPRCKAVIQIPLKSTSVSGLQPIPIDKPKPAPQPQKKPAAPGLTPMPVESNSTSTATPGLSPLPTGSPAPSGLTPIDNGGLTPIEPMGLTPLGESDSGGTADVDPLGVGSIDLPNSPSYSPNPFASPAAVSLPRATNRARRPKSGIHTATTVCASLMIAFAVIQMVWIPLSVAGDIIGGPDTHALAQMAEADRSATLAAWEIGEKIAYVVTGLAELNYLIVLAGAIQMVRFKTWGFGLLASILCMSPCGCLCFLGVPLGIWGIVMLSQGPVRESFS